MRSARAKNGIPNRPVASELVAASDGAIHVRWYRTHGEQFHTKLVMVYGPERLWLTLGSANFTRRNLADYNLEANVAIEVPRSAPLAQQVLEYFDTLWSNRAALGIEYTADFGVYADPSQRTTGSTASWKATGSRLSDSSSSPPVRSAPRSRPAPCSLHSRRRKRHPPDD